MYGEFVENIVAVVGIAVVDCDHGGCHGFAESARTGEENTLIIFYQIIDILSFIDVDIIISAEVFYVF